MPEVRRAAAGDAGTLSQVLARAFAEDAVASYLFPRPEHRARSLVPFFGAQLRHVYLPRGEVYTTADCAGVAMWLAPVPPPARVRDLLGLIQVLSLLGARALMTRRLARFLAARHPRVPHYYLGTLGTDPQRQRQGIAHALMAPVLERCDAERALAYLECSTLGAKALYESLGFSVREEVQTPDGGPHLWLMLRSPS